MLTRRLRSLLLLLLLLPAIAVGGFAQQTSPSDAGAEASQKTASYLFVSPNRRENLTLEGALRKLDSREEITLILAARELSCRVGVEATIVKVIGSWSDGVEHSTLIRIVADEPTVRYVNAWLGQRFRQKSGLYFRSQPSGRGRIYVVHTKRGSRSLARLSRIFDRHGVGHRTIVPGRHRVAVYVVDPENELQQRVISAARQIRARWTMMRGTGSFIGHDSDSSKALEIFAQVVEKYENEHPHVKRECEKRRLRRDKF